MFESGQRARWHRKLQRELHRGTTGGGADDGRRARCHGHGDVNVEHASLRIEDIGSVVAAAASVRADHQIGVEHDDATTPAGPASEHN